MVVKSNTVSLRHKHSLETLIIHITQCMRNVLAVTGNARQSILHLKHCFQQNFIFKNFIFENFIFQKFYQNLFDLILFYLNLIKLKKKFNLMPRSGSGPEKGVQYMELLGRIRTPSVTL